jgi:hypothetical protein
LAFRIKDDEFFRKLKERHFRRFGGGQTIDSHWEILTRAASVRRTGLPATGKCAKMVVQPVPKAARSLCAAAGRVQPPWVITQRPSIIAAVHARAARLISRNNGGAALNAAPQAGGVNV